MLSAPSSVETSPAMSRPRRHLLPALLILLLPAAMWGTSACSPGDADDPGHGTDADVAAGDPACPQPSLRPDGGCCEAGQSYDPLSSACIDIGPPDCSAVSLVAPTACTPRWCWDLKTSDDAPCAKPGLLCRVVGRACTDDERAAGAGCPAGQAPDGDDGCIPPGLPPDSKVPGGRHPAEPPPLPPLPPLTAPRWCLDGAQARLCSSNENGSSKKKGSAKESGCAVGQAPDDDGVCRKAGVDWLCPPGFLVDKDDPGTPTRPPHCLPDPADCGAGPYAASLMAGAGPAKGVWYVHAEAKSGGDGSKAAPLASIGAAVQAAPIGATIALSAGTWKEALPLHKGQQVVGRCAALTRLYNTVKAANVLVDGSSGPVSLRDVSVVGSAVGVLAAAPVKATIERVHIKGASVAGVAAIAKQAHLTLRDVVVAATLTDTDGKNGRGVEASSGGQLTLQRVRVSQQHDIGLLVTGVGSRADADGLLIADTRQTETGKLHGRGVEVGGGASAELIAVRVIGSAESGVRISGGGSRLQARRLHVQGRLTSVGGPQGLGIIGRSGAELTLHGVHIEDAAGHGLHITDGSTAAKVAGLRVERTRPTSLWGHGQGVVVIDGGWLELVGAWLVDNRQAGLSVHAVGSQVWARALQVSGTTPPNAGLQESAGIVLSGGGQLDIVQGRLHSNHGMGLGIFEVGSRATVSDLLADGNVSLADKSPSGMGVAVYLGGRLDLHRSRLSGNGHAGLMLQEPGTLVRASELLVDGSKPEPGEDRFGRAISIMTQARLELRHARLSGNRDRALSVESTGTFAAVEDLLIDNQRSAANNGEGGNGIVVTAGGHLQAGRMRLFRNRSSGILVGNPGTRLDLWGSRIEKTRANEAKNVFGAGLVSLYGSRVEVAGTLSQANRSVGMAAAYDDGALYITGSVVRDTGASTKVEQNGIGVACMKGGVVHLRASAVRDNSVAGVFFGNGKGAVGDSVVTGTGFAGLIGSDGEPYEFGDGLLASVVKDLTISRSLFIDNDRAGVYINFTDAVTVDRILASGNLFGLVTASSHVMTANPATFYNNSQANIAGDTTLSVPDTPAPDSL